MKLKSFNFTLGIFVSAFAKARKIMQLNRYTREFKTNLSIAYPIMLGQLGHILVALADNLMVGQLGSAQLAAVSLGNSLVFIALSIGIGFSFAITPLVAEADGAANIEKGRIYFHHGVIMCAVNGILLFLVLLVVKPVLYMLDQPEEVVILAIPYLEIVAFSMIPLMIFQAFKQFADRTVSSKSSTGRNRIGSISSSCSSGSVMISL